MIKYSLICANDHEFEGWFQNSTAFDAQAAEHQVHCPHCGSAKVEKAIMAPSVATSRQHEMEPSKVEAAREIVEQMRKIRHEIVENAEYVGPRFAEEARKIHNEETSEREIYGEASLDEASSLIEDGISILPMPRLPEDMN